MSTTIIPVNFKSKKREDQVKATAQKVIAFTPRIRESKNTVIAIDFKGTRKMTSREDLIIVTNHDQEFDFTHFKPLAKGTNFETYTPLERMETSEHILKHLKTVELVDVAHFISMGVLDIKKASIKLGLPYRDPKQDAK